MSLWKAFVDYTKRSNARAEGRQAEHDKKVSDGCCCHCTHCHYWGLNGGYNYHCTKKNIDLHEDKIGNHGCSDFSPQDIEWWKT